MRRNDGSIIKGKKRSMRAKKGLAAAAACLTLLVGSAVPVLAAQATGPAAESAWLESGCDVNELEAARDATQLFVVIGNREDPAKSTLSWYQRDEEGRFEEVLTTEAVSGMFGITQEKAEGDKKTPAGVYSFSMAFGLKENPGTILPYHQIREGDYYVDDSRSRYYNQLVNTGEVSKDWNSAEDLMRQAPQYNYALVIDYNPQDIPGKGSAIFLHCPKAANNTGTSGCISVPEELMKEIACQADEGSRIVIVQEERDLANY